MQPRRRVDSTPLLAFRRRRRPPRGNLHSQLRFSRRVGRRDSRQLIVNRDDFRRALAVSDAAIVVIA